MSGSILCPCPLTRKNQFPPHATSPVTGPWPRTSTVTPRALRKLGTFATQTRPSSWSSAVTTPHGRRDAMPAGLDPAEVGERDDEPDRAVPAHPDDPDVVEEDHARGAPGRVGLREKRAHEDVGPAWLVHDG